MEAAGVATAKSEKVNVFTACVRKHLPQGVGEMGKEKIEKLNSGGRRASRVREKAAERQSFSTGPFTWGGE